MIVVAVLSGVFFWAARFTLREKDSFPDSRGHTYAPKSSVRFSSPSSSTAISTTGLSMPKRSSSVGTLHRSSTYRPSAGVSRVSVATPMRTTSGMLSSTRSTMSASSGQRLYSSSSKQIRSYGVTGAGTVSAPTATQRSSRTSYAQGGTGSIGIATPTLSYQRRTTAAASDIAQNDNTVASAMALNSTAGMRYYVQGPFTAAYNTVDNYSYYNPANTSYSTTRRRAYHNGDTEGNGENGGEEGQYYDTDTEKWEWLQLGQTKTGGGYLWTWNGTEWVKGPAQVGDDDDEIDPDAPFIKDQWRNLYYAEYGEYPTDDELEQYIKDKLGYGIFTETGAPIGNGIFILLALIISYALFKAWKTRTTRNNSTL